MSMIFTARWAFDSGAVSGVRVLAGFRSVVGGSARHPSRLQISAGGSVEVFYGEEAVAVLEQLQAAGVLTEAQKETMCGALRDEMMLDDAFTGGAEEVTS